jgi:hypothetical protein
LSARFGTAGLEITVKQLPIEILIIDQAEKVPIDD